MVITNPSLRMPCAGPITIAGILSLHGRHTSSLFLRHHGPPLLTMSTTNIRSHVHGHQLHRIIYNKASHLKSDEWGNIHTGFKAEKVIVGLVVSLCVIGVMSRRYEAQIMRPKPNFAAISQVFENFIGTKRHKISAQKDQLDDPLVKLDDLLVKLDALIKKAITLSKGSPNTQKTSTESQLKEGGEPSETAGLDKIDLLIEKEKYTEALNECNTVILSTLGGKIEIRKFAALIGQAKEYLKDYIHKTKSLQPLDEQSMTKIQKATKAIMNEFEVSEKITTACKRGAFVKTDWEKTLTVYKIGALSKELELHLKNTDIKGKDSLLQFMSTMERAEETLKNYQWKTVDGSITP